jgi:hypothetical protein
VVDKKTPPDFCAGMNLDSSKYTSELRIESGQEAHAMTPQPVAQVMQPHCVQAGIQEQDLEVGASGGVGLEDCGNVLACGAEEADHFSSVASSQ